MSEPLSAAASGTVPDPSTAPPSYVVVLPVKPPHRGKSRLVGVPDKARVDLAAAFALDTVTACLATPRVEAVLVATDDARFSSALRAIGAPCIPDGTGGDLNGTLRETAAEARRRWPHLRPVTVCADLPCLRPDDLEAALLEVEEHGGGPAFVADASRKSALAIAQMVSNAVDGLAPEAVTLLDVHGNLLNQARKDGGEDELNTARIAYRRNIENDLLAKVNSTLEPLLGPDRFRAAVSAEVDYSTADQSEEAFDPAKSVMANSQRTEDTANSAQPTGVPGAPSNLPRPTSRPGLAGAVGVLRRSETINYQTSRMVKRTHIPHGTLRRVSVGVLLDHHVKWEDQGGKGRWTAAPPSAEQLKAAREVVAGAVGLEPDRGDQLVVESLPFERTVSLVSGGPGGPPPEPPGAGGWLGEGLRKKDPVVLGILAALVLTVMAGGWMFWKKKAKRVAVEVTAAPAVVGASSVSAAEDGAGEISAEHRAAEIEGGAESGALAGRFDIQHTAGMVDRQRREEEQEREILESLTTNLKLPSAASKKSEVLAKHLGDEARRNPDGLAQIVRSWINDGE